MAVTVDDPSVGGSLDALSSVFTVNVTDANDTAPVLTVPGTTLLTNEDTPLDLAGAGVTDPDTGDELTATLTVVHGTLTRSTAIYLAAEPTR